MNPSDLGYLFAAGAGGLAAVAFLGGALCTGAIVLAYHQQWLPGLMMWVLGTAVVAVLGVGVTALAHESKDALGLGLVILLLGFLMMGALQGTLWLLSRFLFRSK